MASAEKHIKAARSFALEGHQHLDALDLSTLDKRDLSQALVALRGAANQVVQAQVARQMEDNDAS